MMAAATPTGWDRSWADTTGNCLLQASGLSLKYMGASSDIVSFRGNGPYAYPTLTASPVDSHARLAYFEVTITKLASNQSFSIGFCENEFPTRKFQPGNYQNSYGFHSNGTISKNSTKTVFPFGESFGEGATVGAGLCFDSFNQWRLFFTLNGRFLGYATDLDVVPRGMTCYPIVAVNGAAHLSANFDGIKTPFRASNELLHSLGTKPHSNNYISSLPEEILSLILTEAAETPSIAASALSRVSKQWNKLAESSEIWERLYRARWRRQGKKIKVKNWKRFFQQRHSRLHYSTTGDSFSFEHPQYFEIENCSFDFECPLTWTNLEPDPSSGDDRARHCSKCNQTVHLVQNVEQLNQKVELGECVALNRPYKRMMGKMVRRH